MGSSLEIFSPEMIKTTILTSLLASGAQGGYFALFTWLPTFLTTERKLSVIGSGDHHRRRWGLAAASCCL
jgi:hypothetical protein